MEEEIDLRPYIKAIFNAWYWIVGAAVAAAVAALAVSSLRPGVYQAEASVAIVRERTNVSFGTSIETQEDTLGGRDIRSRLDGLVALVRSNDVAASVLEEIGDELPPDERNVSDLLRMVESGNTGDLILIKVSHQDPELAARIADVWAGVYEQHVNALYVSGTSASLDVIQAQVATAETAYGTAQDELEAFIGHNRITLLEKEIAIKEDLLVTYISATNTIQSAPLEMQANVRQELLANYYADLANIELWLADAQALWEQVGADTGSAAANTGNALALIALRNRIFGGSEDAVILQVDLASPTEPVPLADVAAVIESLETRREETQARIESLPPTFAAVTPEELRLDDDSPANHLIAALDADLLELKASLAAETAQSQELNQKRGLAWETYQSLAKKEQEVAIAAGSTGTEVRLASSSTVPDEPSGTSGLMSAVLAAVVAGMLAVGGVLAAMWWSESETAVESPPARELQTNRRDADG